MFINCAKTSKKIRHIHIMEYYSAIKKILIHATTRMNLKNIMMSEVRHERPRMYDTQIYEMSRKGKDMD